MSGPWVDEIAEDLLAGEAAFEPGEWAAVEDDAFQLLVEARSMGADPREHAAAIIVHLVGSMEHDQPLAPDEEDRRVDLATAAALVYVGRIG
jgi:hypothetical protein